MPVGFQSFREDGKLQFDASMMTFAFHSKGVATTGARFASNTARSTAKVYPPAGLSNYLMATSAGFFAARGGQGTEADGRAFQLFQCDAPQGSSFTYYFFTQANDFPRSNYGMELYDEAGRMTFSSNVDTMVIAGFLSGLSSVTLPAGRTYAALQPQFAGESYETESVRGTRSGQILVGGPDQYGEQYWERLMHGKLHGIKIEGATATSGEVSYDDVWGQTNYGGYPDDPRFFWSQPISNAMILDVSGL